MPSFGLGNIIINLLLFLTCLSQVSPYPAHIPKNSLQILEFVIRNKNIVFIENDEEYKKKILSINDSDNTYGPTIRVQPNDEIRLKVTNYLCDESDLATAENSQDPEWSEYCQAALHFHGLINIGNGVDGVPNLTQSPINPGESYWYNFTIPDDACGTFWYHSHSSVHYGDGIRGLLIVDCDNYDNLKNEIVNYLENEELGTLKTNSLLFENGQSTDFKKRTHSVSENIIKEENILLSDWYKERNIDILTKKVLVEGGTNDPSFKSSLINGYSGDNLQINILNEKTKYLSLRLLNSGTSGTQVFHLNNCKLIVFETDGSLVSPYVMETLTLAVGQRFSVLVKIKTNEDEKFPILKGINGCNKMMGYVVKNLWFTPEENPNEIRAAVDRHIEENSRDTPKISHLPGFINSEIYKEYGNYQEIPLWGKELNEIRRIEISYDNYKDENSYKVNGKTLKEYFENPIEINNDEQSVELIINSEDHMRHPWHLHGFNFQIISIGKGSLKIDDIQYHTNKETVKQYQKDLKHWESNSPIIRDSINIKGNSYIVLRINLLQNQPNQIGNWLLHCHVEWHVSKGLGTVFKINKKSIDETVEPIQPLTTTHSEDPSQEISNENNHKAIVLIIYCILVSSINYYIYIKYI